ncbi:MAG: aminoacetone oxidase family FAD-binding enzyme, partial [Candidatus Cloacimonetes bacterium]|nr:aminoacetone oxidase family FAD-binding enzyme [Candidatus Cloacimonadota bacterium]
MIAIVGAGPAGLAAAIACGKEAVILERNPMAGKKLLLSGSGQCNFTNSCDSESFLKALGEFRNWLKPAFYAFDNRAFIRLLEDAGCPVFIREDGKAFPQSRKSADVRDTLLRLALSRGATIRTACNISGISIRDGGFTLSTDDSRQFAASAIILAAGGASWPQSGSDGSSYRLAQSLGHSIIPPRPALASIRIKDYSAFCTCAGVSLKASLYFGKHCATGDLLFTHTGFSGPLILDNSRSLNAGDHIYLCLADASQISALIQNNPKKRVTSILQMLGLPQSLAMALCNKHGIPADIAATNLKAPERKALTSLLEKTPFTIVGIEGLESSMSDF